VWAGSHTACGQLHPGLHTTCGQLRADPWSHTSQVRSAHNVGSIFRTAETACVHEVRPHTYRGTSLIRNSTPLVPYCRPMPRALWWS